MNKLTIPGILLVILVHLGACTDIEPTLTDPVEKTRSEEMNLNRTLEEALRYADEWFSQMEGGTRAGAREIKSVDFITTGPATRSSQSDTLMYLVNYANEGGFALLGRNKVGRDIYAISDEGRLSMQDTIYNEGLADFMALAIADASMPNVSIPIDTTQLVNPLIYSITRRLDPMLNENVAKWNQSAPFNQYCPIINGKQGVVGCGPVAVGMLMSYYKWPKKIDGVTIPWTSIVDKNDYSAISRFLEDIAGSNYLAAYYVTKNDELSPDARATSTSNIIPTYNKLSYNTSYALASKAFYSVMNDTFNFMKNGYQSAEPAPILMYGYGTNVYTNQSAGHIWVVDGFVERVRKRKFSASWATPEEADPLLHMVWGWGGAANGYYTYFRDERQLSQKTSDEKSDCQRKYGSLSVYGRFYKIYTQE